MLPLFEICPKSTGQFFLPPSSIHPYFASFSSPLFLLQPPHPLPIPTFLPCGYLGT